MCMYGGQKRVSDFLELKLQVVGSDSLDMVTGN